ncbi:hypothetical protein [Maribellus mangrovi]|uniref:hypothetical protein n=1 Tax=Maribellus mangrovi TaxID=3133146 RepID=UPI0030ECBEA0
MSEISNDLAVDLLWFFDSQAWQPELYIDEQVNIDSANLKLGCALTYITDDKNKESEQVRDWQIKTRNLMKGLGFYSGKFKSPDKKYYLKKLQAKKLTLKEPKGRAAHVFVTIEDPGIDEARQTYANEAHARKTKKHGGILIKIKQAEGLSQLWEKLRKELRNRRVISMQFFDHGSVEHQMVGGESLTANSIIPDDIGARFASGAEIRLYGCNTMLEKVPGFNVKSLLATNLGNHLLVKGGTVVGFSKTVDLDITHKRLIEPSAKYRVTRPYSSCQGTNVMAEILNLMQKMKGNHTVKYAFLPQPVKDHEEPVDLLKYPADYPNIGYYA